MKLRIDNKEVEFSNGETILDCAGRAGAEIPTLCHSDGIDHYSSCMICLVRVGGADGFVPSCTALAREGMDIDASGGEVVRMRREALTLLLSEHRAECEAPCRIVCPAGYNIPLMNRLLSCGRYDEAADLIRSETGGDELKCINCRAYCENACRRKKIDTPLSIRNTRMFISTDIKSITGQEMKPSGHAAGVRKRFFSRIGRLDAKEQREWLKECPVDVVRHREINEIVTASEEAESCMHCDCRAADGCRLRLAAEQYGLKDPVSKTADAAITKKINHRSDLIFEHAKCIKCGLCVTAGGDSIAEPSPCFINRGFATLISEPLTGGFEDIGPTVAEKCIGICPTGALAHFGERKMT